MPGHDEYPAYLEHIGFIKSRARHHYDEDGASHLCGINLNVRNIPSHDSTLAFIYHLPSVGMKCG